MEKLFKRKLALTFYLLCLFFLILWFFIDTLSYAGRREEISFPNACVKGESIIIGAVGDVLLHTPLQQKGSKEGFESLWEEALSYLKHVDIAYANLEGPIASGMKRPGSSVYSSFPYFNYHPALALSLKKSGFEIVSTANNHALDRFSKGIDKTIQELDKAGIKHVGTRLKNSKDAWYHIVQKGNIKVAWIACTEMTNGNSDDYHQILYCYKKKDKDEIISMIHELKSKVDAIIISPHWGEEYQTSPNSEQIEFAHVVLEAGATAIIGSHPHVLQPIQKYVTKDGRSTLITYSLGNFVSYQGRATTRTTVILLLGLTKSENGTFINGVRFVPMYMENRSGAKSMHLSRLPTTRNDLGLYRIFARVLPMENALYSSTVVTNPECH